MSDELDWEVMGRLSMEQLNAVDFDAPVTRAELMQSLIAVHEALFAQAFLLQLDVSRNPDVSEAAKQRALKAGGKILKKTGSLIQNWAGVPEPEDNDEE